tara:strand:+ start:25 stop:297 length:273 start_codon:yes stop_codon:yes gene_type:complete
MIFMTSSKLKYKRVKITWYDITQSEATWLHEDDITNTKLAECIDEGYLYKKDKKHVWTFSGYSINDDGTLDVSNVNIFPRAVIKKIEVIK